MLFCGNFNKTKFKCLLNVLFIFYSLVTGFQLMLCVCVTYELKFKEKFVHLIHSA